MQTIIYRGTEVNNIFPYNVSCGKLAILALEQGDDGILPELFSAGRMAYLLCFLNGPREDPNWEAMH